MDGNRISQTKLGNWHRSQVTVTTLLGCHACAEASGAQMEESADDRFRNALSSRAVARRHLVDALVGVQCAAMQLAEGPMVIPP